MHSLHGIGYGAAVACASLSAATTAYGALEADGSGSTIARLAVAEECAHRDANEGCDLDLLRRRLCERGYRLEWLRTENWPSQSDISSCVFNDQ